jgi:hypothetical protein
METHSFSSAAQPGFYDKAFPPSSPPRRADTVPEPSSSQTSTLLGRLTRGSIATNRTFQSDGLAALGSEASVEPFADIRATNSPSSSSRKTEKTVKQSIKTKDSGRGVRGKAKGETAQATEEIGDQAEEFAWLDDHLATMDDVVIEKSNVLMM